jgi:hypothetical protein
MRDRDRLMIAAFGARGIAHGEQHVATQANRLGLNPSSLCFLRQALRLGEVPKRGLRLPGHPAGIGKQSEIPRREDHELPLVHASQAHREQRNSFIRATQCRKTPAAINEDDRPKGSESMLDCDDSLVGVLQQRFGVRAKAPARSQSVHQRESQCEGMGEPARLRQRRVTPEQSLIEMSEARERPAGMAQ